MVYIEIIYLVLYSIVCFLIVKNIHKTKVDEIYNDYINKLKRIDSEFLSLRRVFEDYMRKAQQDISDQNKQYLSEMNRDISKKIKELSDNIKNRPVI